ncbi:hypothetical protein SAMN06297387_1127 [Streptomyces zhaozhouensis]|uniref:Uncharacterized protein n=1 Tax=Streptomyces zhaozhouensis TaxID=1300267 RepID=A0A286DYM7_9ACTN|nr:hypothetical protein [Streptomyces zhaozhouensis]SOD63654.1 hypothetical protein SAMN06297387_1127 [Streptomyces zhaozhouensis]
MARPTEGAAVAAVSRSVRPAPALLDLFEALRVAHAMRDRHGMRLVRAAIARNVSTVGGAS